MTTLFEVQEKLIGCVGLSGRHPDTANRDVNAGVLLPYDDRKSAMRELYGYEIQDRLRIPSTCALFALHFYMIQVLGLGQGTGKAASTARAPYYWSQANPPVSNPAFRMGKITGDLAALAEEEGLSSVPRGARGAPDLSFGTAKDVVVKQIIDPGDVVHIANGVGDDHFLCVYDLDSNRTVIGVLPNGAIDLGLVKSVDGGQVDNSWIMERTRRLVWFRNRYYLVDADRPFSGEVPRGRMVQDVIKTSRKLSG